MRFTSLPFFIKTTVGKLDTPSLETTSFDSFSTYLTPFIIFFALSMAGRMASQ
jgi:hypothetical protein